MKHVQKYDAFINEALRYSEVKEYIKTWKEIGGEERYRELFGGKYRLYLDLSGEKSNTHFRVEEVLTDNGYYIVDYHGNEAKKLEKEDKRVFGIGKLLNRFAPDLKSQYDVDKDKTSGSDEYKVVISRHPYDIVGMSTDRQWHSCMDIRKDDNNHKFVIEDVKEGTLVAYLITREDTNINDPINRLLIKPFHKDGDTKLVSDAKVYSGVLHKEIDGFRATVDKWLHSIQGKIQGTYRLNPNLYGDGKTMTIEPRVIAMLKKEYDFFYPFEGDCAITRIGRHYGLVNSEGVEVAPVVYEAIRECSNTIYLLRKRDGEFGGYQCTFYNAAEGTMSDAYDTAEPLPDCNFIISIDGSYGLYNANDNKITLPLEYEYIHKENTKFVSIEDEDENVGFAKPDGTLIHAPMFADYNAKPNRIIVFDHDGREGVLTFEGQLTWN